MGNLTGTGARAAAARAGEREKVDGNPVEESVADYLKKYCGGYVVCDTMEAEFSRLIISFN